MRPRLQRVLSPDRSRKAGAPLLPWIGLRHALDGGLADQLRLTAHIIEDRCELDKGLDARDCAFFTEILVTNNGLRDVLGLLFWSAKGLQELEREQPPIELKGHQRGANVGVGRPNVVKHGGEEVRLDE